MAIVLTLATCGKHRSPGKTIGPPAPQSLKEQQRDAASSKRVLTQEDRMLIAMPYEERLAYLEDKVKDLVYEMHGIVIEESATATRTASEVDEDWPYHKVRKGSDKEELELDNSHKDEHRWPLTFLERVRGDLNFDGEVGIEDITPIAINWGAHYDDDPLNPRWVPVDKVAAPHVDRLSSGNESIGIEDITPLAIYFGDAWGGQPPEWPNNEDPHLDRISDHNGVIGISDITPIAMNFGKQLAGYDVYWRRGENSVKA